MHEPIEEKDMKDILEKNFDTLWMESFGILESKNLLLGEIRVKKDNKNEIKILKDKIARMERDVEEYKNECYNNFNHEMLGLLKMDLSAFKNNIFGKELWTVKSALTDMNNKELDRYRESFENATAKVSWFSGKWTFV